MKDEPLLSPATYLKNKWADIRNLEENILYMQAQGKARLQMAEAVTRKQTAMRKLYRTAAAMRNWNSSLNFRRKSPKDGRSGISPSMPGLWRKRTPR